MLSGRFLSREGQPLDKTLVGLLGAASALALAGGVQTPTAATPLDPAGPTLQPARSFAELLDPIPNAGSVLRAEDQRLAGERSADENPIVTAQYYYHHHHHHYYHHHHHHYHHHYYRHHHHHHHHHYHHHYNYY
jgi:hypothetical protein